jgi:hypothetical protein
MWCVLCAHSFDLCVNNIHICVRLPELRWPYRSEAGAPMYDDVSARRNTPGTSHDAAPPW